MNMQTLHYGTKPGHFETSKIHFPSSEGVSEVSERASERANGRASGPVLTSLFLFVPDHSALIIKYENGKERTANDERLTVNALVSNFSYHVTSASITSD